MTAEKIITDLVECGITKWKISKKINVSWRTVHMWHRGVTTPNEFNMNNLFIFYNINKDKTT